MAIIPGAGVSPASTWTVPVEPAPLVVPALLADDIDQQTGELRAIASAPHAVDAAIRQAFRLRAGSGPSVGIVGQRFDRIAKKGDTVDRELRAEATRILAPFVERGLVRVETMLTETDATQHGADGAAVLVRYTNLLTARPQEIRA